MLIGLFASSRLARSACPTLPLYSRPNLMEPRASWGAVELLNRITFERDESRRRPLGSHIRRIISDETEHDQLFGGYRRYQQEETGWLTTPDNIRRFPGERGCQENPANKQSVVPAKAARKRGPRATDRSFWPRQLDSRLRGNERSVWLDCSLPLTYSPARRAPARRCRRASSTPARPGPRARRP